MKVIIDGVLYVPVSEASIDAAKLEDAIVSAWWGDGWRTGYPRALEELHIYVTDIWDPYDGGETIPEFIARVLA